MATTLDEVIELAKREQGLAVVATLRADQSIQASLVNAGALLHPATGDPAIAFVTYGETTARLADLSIGLVVGDRGGPSRDHRTG